MASAAINELVLARPGPALSDAVAFYAGYRTRDGVPEIHRGLPSPFLTLIFTLDEPLHMVRRTDPSLPARSFDSLVGGLHTKPVLISHDGNQSGIQVHLNPLGARMVLGCPAAEIAGLDLDADEVLAECAERTREQLVSAGSWRARFAVIDRELSRHLADQVRDVAPEIRYAWNRLTGPAVSVAEVAEETGWSDRHLANQMRVETGLRPKQVARLARFDRARRQLQRSGGGDISAIAVDNGYFDEAHMSRDFTDLAGLPPLRWLMSEFGNIQSLDGGSAQRSVS